MDVSPALLWLPPPKQRGKRQSGRESRGHGGLWDQPRRDVQTPSSVCCPCTPASGIHPQVVFVAKQRCAFALRWLITKGMCPLHGSDLPFLLGEMEAY